MSDVVKDLAATDRPLGEGVLPNVGPVEPGEPESFDLPEKIEDYTDIVAAQGVAWVPVLKRLSINLFIPFINGIMLGFGEIIAHEVGLLFGWRTANVVDPSARPPATNPRQRRKWLFGFM